MDRAGSEDSASIGVDGMIEDTRLVSVRGYANVDSRQQHDPPGERQRGASELGSATSHDRNSTRITGKVEISDRDRHEITIEVDQVNIGFLGGIDVESAGRILRNDEVPTRAIGEHRADHPGQGTVGAQRLSALRKERLPSGLRGAWGQERQHRGE